MKHLSDILQRLNGRVGIIADQMVLSGGNFVLVVLLARGLGIEAFGHFALAWMAVLFALSLHQAFITQPMFTFYGKLRAGRRRPWLGVLAWGHLPMGAVLVFAGALMWAGQAVGLVGASWQYIGQIMAVFSPLYLMQEFVRKASFAERQILRPLLADVLTLLLLLAGLGAMYIRDTLHLSAVLWWWSASLAAGLGVMGPQLKSLLLAPRAWPPRLRRRLRSVVWTRHYHFSKWLLGKALLQWFSGNAFIITGASVLGPAAAGAVRMAQNILGLTHVLFLSLESIVPVQAARQLFDFGYSAFAKYMQVQGLRFGLITGALLALLAVGAEPITALLYGTEAVQWAWVVRVYCVLYVFVYATLMVQFAIRTFEHTRPIFWGYAASAAFSLLTATPLVRHYQMTGLLIGLIFSQCIPLVICLIALRKKTVHWRAFRYRNERTNLKLEKIAS